jgi:hypothetical protein
MQGQVLTHSFTIAVIVGTFLSAINQGDVIARGPLTPLLAFRIFMNYLVPFIVSSASAAANRPHSETPPVRLPNPRGATDNV